MPKSYTVLLTIMEKDNSLTRVAIEVNPDILERDVFRYWAEPENQEAIQKHLPYFLQDIGPVVKVHDILSICKIDK